MPEATHAYLGALRGLGRIDDYETQLRAFVDGHPESPFAESALNDLATYYILADDDAKAADVFADQYGASRRARSPIARPGRPGGGRTRGQLRRDHSPLRNRGRDDAARRLSAVLALLGGARHMHLGHRDAAITGYQRVIADYRNSYYGRRPRRESPRFSAATRPAGAGAVSPARRDLPPTLVVAPPPANAPLIQHLLAAGMYDDAIGELRRLQATAARRRCSRRRSPTRSTATATCARPSTRCVAPIRSSWRRAARRCRSRS